MTDDRSYFERIAVALEVLGLYGSSYATRDDAEACVAVSDRHPGVSVELAAQTIAVHLFRPALLEKIKVFGNHAMCDDCWVERWGTERRAVRIIEDKRASERCCWCHTVTDSGIYVRDAYANTACTDLTCPELADETKARLMEELEP